MFEIMIIVIIFFGAIALFIWARFGGFFQKPSLDSQRPSTSSEKLFQSKANDIAFFDGESEGYAEAMSRLRQFGGA